MARVTPTQAAEKWSRRLSGATQDITNGVNALTTNPMESAAAAQDRMVARWNDSVTSGKWKAGLARVSLADWKQQMLTKGVGRISQGVQQSQGKMAGFFEELLPFQDNLSRQIKQMPNVTIEDSINRVAAQMRGMQGFRRSTATAGRR